jgi:hypothetical protein
LDFDCLVCRVVRCDDLVRIFVSSLRTVTNPHLFSMMRNKLCARRQPPTPTKARAAGQRLWPDVTDVTGGGRLLLARERDGWTVRQPSLFSTGLDRHSYLFSQPDRHRIATQM